MAISVLNVYTAGQNGHTEITRLPAGNQVHLGHEVPEWAVRSLDATSQVIPPHQNPSVKTAVDESAPIAALPSPAVPSTAQAKVSLNDLVKKYKQEWNNLAPGTRAKMGCHFIVAARHLNFERDVTGIKLADLRELKSKLSEGRKPASVNDILFKGLGALFKMALEDEIIDRSPLERLARARRGETDRQQPTWDQAQMIEVEVSRYAPESALIIGFMRNFGIGQAEIRYLVGENIDCATSIIHFRRKKTGKPFDVPIFSHSRIFVERLKEAGRLKVGRPIVQWRNPRKALETACERLGLPSYEPRALRRCFIVHCLQQGIDPRVVAKWQGHKDAKLIFSVYGKFIDQGYERAQAEKLEIGKLLSIPNPGQVAISDASVPEA